MLKPCIRAASAGDVEAIAALNTEVQELHFASRPDQFRTARVEEIAPWITELLHNPSARLWVAELGGAVVGYVVTLVRERPENPFCPARTWWEIDNLGVQAKHRRGGIGRALVSHVVDEARARGIRDLELQAWAFNQNAQQAFRSLGFVPKVVRFELSTSAPESA
jgi:ribosomal protein S18 acetylase RimI-like enzyme